MKLAKAALLFSLVQVAAWAQVNVGEQTPEASLPFTMTTVANGFKFAWRLAFLPDGRMLITEKVGPVWLVSQDGQKIPVGGTPPVYFQGQNGMMASFSRHITPMIAASISPMSRRVNMAEASRSPAPN